MNKMLFFIFILLYLFIGIVYSIGEFDNNYILFLKNRGHFRAYTMIPLGNVIYKMYLKSN